jgi:hypothetical protein
LRYDGEILYRILERQASSSSAAAAAAAAYLYSSKGLFRFQGLK